MEIQRLGLHSIYFYCTQAIAVLPPGNFLLVAQERKIETKKKSVFVYPPGEYTLELHTEETLGGL